MTIENLLKRKKPRRKVEGIAAALLPYREDGKVAVEEFQKHLVATQKAGLQNAVNMDTGYVNYLSDSEKLEILRWTREALGPNTPFVAGAYIEHARSGCERARLAGNELEDRGALERCFFDERAQTIRAATQRRRHGGTEHSRLD